MSDYINKDESYRNHLATVSVTGKRTFIHPKKPSGKLHSIRAVVAWILLAFLFSAPFITMNGHQMLQFNVIERTFIVFGVLFRPQDFFIFALSFLVLLLFIATFTSIFGRLWCGWACPQTIFLEFVFRKIEYLIEGDFLKQKTLEAMKWNAEKIIKKFSKHIIFFSISFLIANTFLAYIIGSESVLKIIFEPVEMHLTGFIAITIFSFVFYMVFARFREQACIIACPYGRFQSVMVDDKTIAVTYDFKRGEPRGKMVKGSTETKGDCIDCHQCVHVCPTGIDIRNGIQLECVNCTACIDACDEVMTKIKKPKGLIRYASYENIVKGTTFKLNARNFAYISVLTILTTILIFIFSNREQFDALLLRQPGTIYQQIDQTHFANMYNLKVSNKTDVELKSTLEVTSIPAEIKFIDDFKSVEPQGIKEFKLFIVVDKKYLQSNTNHLELIFRTQDGGVKKIKTQFLAPGKL